jgi:uncharacterized protein YegP (UPF0339 family)
VAKCGNGLDTQFPHAVASAGVRSSVASGREDPSTRGRRHAWKVVLKKGLTDKFSFNLVVSNGQVIATSESYDSKQAALNGIESVMTNAPGATTEDQTES